MAALIDYPVMFAVLLVVMQHRHLAFSVDDIKVFFFFFSPPNSLCIVAFVLNGHHSIVKTCAALSDSRNVLVSFRTFSPLDFVFLALFKGIRS